MVVGVGVLFLGSSLAPIALVLTHPELYALEEGLVTYAEAHVGPYTMEVNYYGPPVAGRDLQFELRSYANAIPAAHYDVTAVPDSGRGATVKAEVAEPDARGHAFGVVHLPASSGWHLEIIADGPIGSATGAAPLAGQSIYTLSYSQALLAID